MSMEREIRSIASAPKGGADSRRIEGYAIVFNSESRVLTTWDGAFVETIEPDAISDELLREADVKCLFNHNREALLARCVRGEGTLELVKDETGLRYSFEAPKTIDGDKVLELVRRGDLAGSSFAFSATGEGAVDYYEDADGVLHRVVRKITGLYDVSPVIDPAYMATSVEARAWEAETPVEEKPIEARENQGMTESAAVYHRVKLGL
jgi:HK97 family phage prohead protease